MQVLVMTEYWQTALACIQSFGRRGHRVCVLHHPGYLSPHAYSRFVHKRIPFDHDSGTRAERAGRLLQLLRSESIDLVIPISDEDAHLLAECKAREPERQGLISPALACIEIARDRALTETFCRDNAIRIPQSIQVSSLEALRAAASELGFPMLVKESYSFASNGIGMLYSEQDIDGLDNRFATGRALQAQRFIQGELVGVTGFGWQGQLQGSFSFRIEHKDSQGGTPPYAFTETSTAPAAMLAHIVKCLNWSGGIDLDLIRDAAGELYLLEINPRLSGTTIFPLKLGIDLPRLYEVALKDAFDQLDAPPAVPESVLFISNPEEVLLLSKNPHVNHPKSLELRKKFRYVESLFLDDPGLTRSQFSQFLQLAWFTARTKS
jgi:biotin carboxylase